jgi:hypothetical protein
MISIYEGFIIPFSDIVTVIGLLFIHFIYFQFWKSIFSLSELRAHAFYCGEVYYLVINLGIAR